MGDLNHVKGQKDKGTGAFQSDAPAHFGGTGSMPRTGKVGRHAMPPTQGAYRGGAQAAGQNAYAPASSFDGIAAGDSEKIGGPRKAVLIALGVIVALLAIAYAAGVFVFHERFYPQTTLGALDISMSTHQEASSALAAIEDDYEVQVKGEGLDLVVDVKDGGVSIDSDAVVNSAASDVNPWLWFIQIWGTHDVTDHLAATSDSGALGEFVRGNVDAFNETAEPSQDAALVYSTDSGAYEIKQEVYGDQISSEAVTKAIAEAIAGMEATVSVTEDMLIKPSVLSTDERLASGRDAANAMIKCDVTLKSSSTGVTAGEVNGDVISQWITFDESFTPTLDEAAMGAWIDNLASAYNTVGTQRTYTRGDGKQVTVSGGVYGWAVDAETLKTAVRDAIANGTQGDLEIAFTSTGNGYTAPGMDWGAYCDVDLTEQHARYYDASGNLLWESGVVTGVPDAENATPTGVYWLNNLQTNVSLKGPIDPETNKPKWDSPVSYWMPFVGNLVGLHDANWQPSWVFSDPSAFYFYGSHGCVNLPVDKAAQLFNIIQIGDAVIVHW